MFIHPSLLKKKNLEVPSKVFVCGPGYGASNIDIRNIAKSSLKNIENVEVVYGEEIEKQFRYKKQATDLQTLEARYAHDVDFTLLILESPGSIAELGTFSHMPGLYGRLVVLVPKRFFRSESYIARGPLSLITRNDPNSVIYFDEKNKADMISRVVYPLTFFKFSHCLGGSDYLTKTRLSYGARPSIYGEYMASMREKYNMAIALISVMVGYNPSYSDLLLLSGLAPKQLNSSLHALFQNEKIEKTGVGRYHSMVDYKDKLLTFFSSTEISKRRAKMISER
ncbi:MAG: retron St85 family effector protein [Candidatus Ochrobactrum gambitense]|nr:MAG: retron St85 family effector protein [Candidatus Ochrobactrum gambitense]WEK16561.1 MAG: retron St85 family effector protein [Candidatus Ochrobactrum gambitense]